MTTIIESLQKERTQLYEDLYDGIIPKRVPISVNFQLELCLELSNMPMAQTQWTMNGLYEAFDRACSMFKTDINPFTYNRHPAFLNILGSRSFVMGSNGHIQHPEIHCMEADEYEKLIENPYDFTLEHTMERLNGNLKTDPVTKSLVMAKAALAMEDSRRNFAEISDRLTSKYGYRETPPMSGALTLAPFDYIGDWLRGFSQITMDVRRRPEVLKEACEAVLPLVKKRGLSKYPHKHGQTFIALHMATYLRTKDFEEIYWPTLNKLVHALAEEGQPCYLFCEDDWTRYLDHLQDLPENTRLKFEYGDPKLIKEKLGKKHILTGLYPLSIVKTESKEKCIDKAKELIDIMAPGGKYYFTFDKSPLTVRDINVDTYKAVIDYVAENAYYYNAGQQAAKEVAPQKSVDVSGIPEFESKYYIPWSKFKEQNGVNPEFEDAIEPIIQQYEDLLFGMAFESVQM